MRAKLKKNELPSGYFLYNEKGDLIASTIKGYKKQPLSPKNCEAIECGYDLDDCVDYFEKGKLYIQQDGVIILAGENGNNGIIIQDPLETRGVGHYSDEWNPKAFCEFKQKALELMGDKKFSKENMLKAFITGVFTDETSDHDFEFTELMKDLQQTEWGVEVEMEYYDPLPPTRQTSLRPKLDADGCLILRKI